MQRLHEHEAGVHKECENAGLSKDASRGTKTISECMCACELYPW